MKSSLRILHLEDDPTDAQLIQETLSAGDIACDVRRVETEAEFAEALGQGDVDLILADCTLPSFDGLSAFRIAQHDQPQVPFIFVSGTLDEEVAIDAVKMGATDYVFKTRLSRLVPSVQRALRETEGRAEMRRAEEALHRSEQSVRLIVDGIAGLVATMTAEGEVELVNRQVLEYFGKTLQDLKGWTTSDAVHPGDLSDAVAAWRHSVETGDPYDVDHRLRRADGVYRWFHSRGLALRDSDGRIVRWFNLLTDIDDRKRAEERLKHENLALREEVDHASMFEEIVGTSPALRTVLSHISKVAPSDSTVLITGETGTGKELVARAIHKRSQRSSRAFVSVNCAATPQTLIAAELFGHEKGAFTGAMQRRLGRFELAEGGTIFLDEVGELPMETQIALLRVLQEREFERVGGSHTIRADVRVIAATNRDLQSAISAGAFRKDLYYRLNVLPIEIPPLRERQEDIPRLVEYFIQRYAGKAGKKITTIEKRTLDLLQTYGWPGNVRELQNVIERSVIFCDAEVFAVDAGWLSFESSSGGQDSETTTRKSPAEEKAAIEAALSASGGRISGPSGAATRLGIPASTLESKIRALHINKFRYKKI